MKRLARLAIGSPLLGVVTCLLILACTGCQASSFVIRPYLLAPGANEMTVQWASDRPGPAVLRYGAGAELNRRQPTSRIDLDYYPLATRKEPTFGPKKTGYLYRARLTDLTPGTQYRYSAEMGSESADGQFRTMPAVAAGNGQPGQPVPFSFAVYGDSRTGVEQHRAVALAIKAANPAFILHTGDLTDNGAFGLYPRQVFDPLHDVVDHIPMFTQVGNHEEWRVYRSLLPMPGNGQWYSFDYANLHVIALDSCVGPTNLPKMLAWLEQDLAASKADWKVVYYHYPTYDVARRHTMWGREKVAPLFRKYGVDLVLSGHSHSYQRLRPMYVEGENEDHPITYMITAGGGAPMHTLESTPYAAMANTKLHFVQFRIDGLKLTGQAIGTDGKVFDQFQIDRSSGRADESYRVSALPEMEFDTLRNLVAGQLRGLYAPELPLPDKPAVYTIPIKAGDKPLKLKLFLNDTKDSPYEMDAVKVDCPAGQTVQAVCTLRVNRPIVGKGNALDPEVSLECHYECGPQKGVVYGSRLRFGPPVPEKPTSRADEASGGSD